MRKLFIIIITVVLFTGTIFALKFLINENVNFPDHSEVVFSETSKDTSTHVVKALPIPLSMVFAGEDVPLHFFDIRERLDRELIVNTFWHSNTLLTIKRSNRYFPYISKILQEYGIPDDLKYIPLIESGFTNAVSPAKAVGFWQFLEGTAREFGLEVNSEVDERYHWKKSTEAACKHLIWLKKQFDTWAMVCAAYNCGSSGLKKHTELQKNENYFNLLLAEETERYLFRMFAFKIIMNNPKKFGFDLSISDLYPYIETQNITITETIPNLAQWAANHGLTYKELKYFNPWIRGNTLTIKKNKEYEIEVPFENYRLIYKHLLH